MLRGAYQVSLMERMGTGPRGSAMQNSQNSPARPLPRDPPLRRPLGTIFSQGERAAPGWYAALGIPQEGARACPFWVVSRPAPPARAALTRGGRTSWTGNLGVRAERGAGRPGCPRVPGLARGQPTAWASFYGLCACVWPRERDPGGPRAGQRERDWSQRHRDQGEGDLQERHRDQRHMRGSETAMDSDSSTHRATKRAEGRKKRRWGESVRQCGDGEGGRRDRERRDW